MTLNQKKLYYDCNLYKSEFDSSPDNANKIAHFDLLPFCPNLASIIVISFYTFKAGQIILWELMSISELKPVLRNIGISQRNRQKTVKKLHPKGIVNLKKC